MQKDDLNVHVFQYKNWLAQNLMNDFFLAFTVRGLFHKKDFKWKKIWEKKSLRKETEALYAELNES